MVLENIGISATQKIFSFSKNIIAIKMFEIHWMLIEFLYLLSELFSSYIWDPFSSCVHILINKDIKPF